MIVTTGECYLCAQDKQFVRPREHAPGICSECAVNCVYVLRAAERAKGDGGKARRDMRLAAFVQQSKGMRRALLNAVKHGFLVITRMRDVPNGVSRFVYARLASFSAITTCSDGTPSPETMLVFKTGQMGFLTPFGQRIAEQLKDES